SLRVAQHHPARYANYTRALRRNQKKMQEIGIHGVLRHTAVRVAPGPEPTRLWVLH
ncbi:hypothetical protein A2U01_0100203, partial [Trifolium medium]|nr:hypothetical protein [Trifolium medium]